MEVMNKYKLLQFERGRSLIAILLTGVLLFFAACAKPGPTAPPAIPAASSPIPLPGLNEVWVPGKEFKPAVLIVPVGTTVIWVSKDSDEHTITSDTGRFNGPLTPYGSFSGTFTERGTFNYFCTLHPEMIGTIVVE